MLRITEHVSGIKSHFSCARHSQSAAKELYEATYMALLCLQEVVTVSQLEPGMWLLFAFILARIVSWENKGMLTLAGLQLVWIQEPEHTSLFIILALCECSSSRTLPFPDTFSRSIPKWNGTCLLGPSGSYFNFRGCVFKKNNCKLLFCDIISQKQRSYLSSWHSIRNCVVSHQTLVRCFPWCLILWLKFSFGCLVISSCPNPAKIELLLIGLKHWCRRVCSHDLHLVGSELLTGDFIRNGGVILKLKRLHNQAYFCLPAKACSFYVKGMSASCSFKMIQSCDPIVIRLAARITWSS